MLLVIPLILYIDNKIFVLIFCFLFFFVRCASDPEHLDLNFQYERIKKMGRGEASKSYDLHDAYIDRGLGLPRDKWKMNQFRIEYNNFGEKKQCYK